MQSFRKYVGGSAANICIGTARLGLKSALIGRVGSEQMGAFVRRTIEMTDAGLADITADNHAGFIDIWEREKDRV